MSHQTLLLKNEPHRGKSCCMLTKCKCVEEGWLDYIFGAFFTRFFGSQTK